MKTVQVRDTGMGWFVMTNKRNPCRSRLKKGDMITPWKGNARKTLLHFLVGVVADFDPQPVPETAA